jgi:hypothetical protein
VVRVPVARLRVAHLEAPHQVDAIRTQDRIMGAGPTQAAQMRVAGPIQVDPV